MMGLMRPPRSPSLPPASDGAQLRGRLLPPHPGSRGTAGPTVLRGVAGRVTALWTRRFRPGDWPRPPFQAPTPRSYTQRQPVLLVQWGPRGQVFFPPSWWVKWVSGSGHSRPRRYWFSLFSWWLTPPHLTTPPAPERPGPPGGSGHPRTPTRGDTRTPVGGCLSPRKRGDDVGAGGHARGTSSPLAGPGLSCSRAGYRDGRPPLTTHPRAPNTPSLSHLQPMEP